MNVQAGDIEHVGVGRVARRYLVGYLLAATSMTPFVVAYIVVPLFRTASWINADGRPFKPGFADRFAFLGTGGWILLCVFALIIVAIPATYFTSRSSQRDLWRERTALEKLVEAEGELERESGLSLPTLWRVTNTQLEYYHQIVTSQARRSFRNAQGAMVVGFGPLVVLAIVAIGAHTVTSSIIAGSLGIASAAFSAFLSRTFIRSQEGAASQLRTYFDQPLELSRYLAAERLLGEMNSISSEEKGKVAVELVRAIALPESAFSASVSNSEPAADTGGWLATILQRKRR